jgi:hypothetical protein
MSVEPGALRKRAIGYSKQPRITLPIGCEIKKPDRLEGAIAVTEVIVSRESSDHGDNRLEGLNRDHRMIFSREPWRLSGILVSRVT